LQIRPRMSWHGGAEPEIIPPQKKSFNNKWLVIIINASFLD
jgi:hypothetical protein